MNCLSPKYSSEFIFIQKTSHEMSAQIEKKIMQILFVGSKILFYYIGINHEKINKILFEVFISIWNESKPIRENDAMFRWFNWQCAHKLHVVDNATEMVSRFLVRIKWNRKKINIRNRIKSNTDKMKWNDSTRTQTHTHIQCKRAVALIYSNSIKLMLLKSSREKRIANDIKSKW